jgi:hypothetical protein
MILHSPSPLKGPEHKISYLLGAEISKDLLCHFVRVFFLRVVWLAVVHRQAHNPALLSANSQSHSAAQPTRRKLHTNSEHPTIPTNSDERRQPPTSDSRPPARTDLTVSRHLQSRRQHEVEHCTCFSPVSELVGRGCLAGSR